MADMILNGKATGSVASRLLSVGMDPTMLRPYIAEDGKPYVTVGNEAQVTNDATLLKDEWKLLDDAVIPAARERLNAVQDLRDRGLTMDIPDGMGVTVLQHQAVSKFGKASVGMDPIAETDRSRPKVDLTNLPLPVTYQEFSFSSRVLAASRRGNLPLDVSGAQEAARNVAEEIEKMLLGKGDTYAYGGGNVYGYTNFPHRETKSLTGPTSTSWTPQDTVDDVLAMRQQSYAKNHYGPFVLYAAPNWDTYLDKDYSENKGDNTLRQRIAAVPNIEGVITVDHLENYEMVLVQMTSNVVEEVVGMDITTVQWESRGGFELNFMVLGIMVPRIRADYHEQTGLVVGTV